MRIPTHSSGPWSRNSFGKPNSFSHCPLSRSLPTLPAVASPFYDVLSTEPVCACVQPILFRLSRCLRVTEIQRKGIEAWASVRFDCVSELKQIMEVRCLSVVDDLMLSSSSRLAFGGPCKYLFTSSRWEQIILLNDALRLNAKSTDLNMNCIILSGI